MLYVLGFFFRIVHTFCRNLLLRLESKRWTAQAIALCNRLDAIEKVPLFWPLNGTVPQPLEEILDKVRSHLLEPNNFPPSKKLDQLKFALRRRLLALDYRLQPKKGHPSELHLVKLERLAEKWYEENPLHHREMIPHSVQKQLKAASCYPAFVDLLFEDPELLKTFEIWTLRDRNPTEPFIEYPAMQSLLVDSNLAGRLQRAYPAGLKIVTGGNQKYLAMLFEGRYLNILEEDETITLKGGWSLTLREVFTIFKNKNFDPGGLEFFTGGVTNWNALKLAWWNDLEKCYMPIDVEQPKWWLELPILQVLDRSEARQRYGFAVDGKHWIAAATATRGTVSLDYDQSHAFIEVAIPMRDGRYSIFDFGKFATTFPKNMIETLLLFANSVHAAIAYPDENAYYTHRQHAQHAFVLSPSEAETLMEIIKKDILKGREKNLVYQIESENCAKWVQTTLQDVLGLKVPNMFIMPLIDAEPQGPVYGLFSLLRMMPYDLPSRILVKMHYPLGAWRGTWIEEEGKRIWKALNNHPFWHSGLVYLPAFLHKQRTTGLLPVVNGGRSGVLLRKHQLDKCAATALKIEEISSSKEGKNLLEPGNKLPLQIMQESLRNAMPLSASSLHSGPLQDPARSHRIENLLKQDPGMDDLKLFCKPRVVRQRLFPHSQSVLHPISPPGTQQRMHNAENPPSRRLLFKACQKLDQGALRSVADRFE